MAAIPESARSFMSGLVARARKLKKTIVFPEGSDARGRPASPGPPKRKKTSVSREGSAARVLQAAARLVAEGAAKPVLIGPRPANAPEGVTFVDPARSPLVEKDAAPYYERRAEE